MVDDRAWKLEVSLFRRWSFEVGGAPGRVRRWESGTGDARRLTRRLRRRLPDQVVISQDGRRILLDGQSSIAVDDVRKTVSGLVVGLGLPATITLHEWDGSAKAWRQIDGPRSPRLEHARRPPPSTTPRPHAHADLREEDSDVIADFRAFGGPRAHPIFWALAVLCAAGGAAWYALSPGIASYQALTLTAPLLLGVLVWLHRRLPGWLEWILAVALAAGGEVSYAVIGGSQLWAWGQAAVLPLFLLVIARATKPGRGPSQSEPWYGGPIEGPWGPP